MNVCGRDGGIKSENEILRRAVNRQFFYVFIYYMELAILPCHQSVFLVLFKLLSNGINICNLLNDHFEALWNFKVKKY